MKKLYSTISMLLLGLMAFTMSSCDDDTDIALSLEGTWRGNMYVQHEYGGNYYESIYSVIDFAGDPYHWTSGSGYWVDYYSSSPWGRDYVANHIDWKVRNGVIYIYFREEGTSIEIWDYRLTNHHFTGVIRDGSNHVEFDLTHTSSRNWDDYYYYDSYYAPQRSISKDGTAAVQDRPVRSFRTK